MVVEQAQILTTHNLATLVRTVDVHPASGWRALAGHAFGTVLALADQLRLEPARAGHDQGPRPTRGGR